MKEFQEMERAVTNLLQEVEHWKAEWNKEHDARVSDRVRLGVAVVGVADKTLTIEQLIMAANLQHEVIADLRAKESEAVRALEILKTVKTMEACAACQADAAQVVRNAEASRMADQAQYSEWREQMGKDLASALRVTYTGAIGDLIDLVRRKLNDLDVERLKVEHALSRNSARRKKPGRSARDRALIAEALGLGRAPKNIGYLVYKASQMRRDSEALGRVNTDATRQMKRMRDRDAYIQNRAYHHAAVCLYEQLTGKTPTQSPMSGLFFEVPDLGAILDRVGEFRKTLEWYAKDDNWRVGSAPQDEGRRAKGALSPGSMIDYLEVECFAGHVTKHNFQRPKTREEAVRFVEALTCPECRR